jgi:serine/threonine-protein kinase
MDKEKFGFIFKVTLGGIVVFFLTALLVMRFIFTISTIAMPDFTGVPFDSAKKVAEKLKLNLKIENEIFTNVYESGCIVSQDIKPKSKIKKGRAVYVVVSMGSKMIAVPNITGMMKPNAVLTIKQSNLDDGFETIVTSGIYKENTVMSQYPAPGENVPTGTKVDLLRSGPPEVPNFLMPSFINQNIFDVFKILKDNQLFVTSLTINVNETLDSGTILDQSPGAGNMINKDTPIVFTINKKASDPKLKNKLIKITYKMEGYDVSKLVKINLFDLGGNRVVYNKVTGPNEVVDLKESILGEALVQIFIGTDLVKEIEY